ncbi:MAG: LamG domain-containing protein, partial [Pirellulaceae bacterium]|nr:LamG domain-containing protein [Pirellulaceae bacterium]
MVFLRDDGHVNFRVRNDINLKVDNAVASWSDWVNLKFVLDADSSPKTLKILVDDVEKGSLDINETNWNKYIANKDTFTSMWMRLGAHWKPSHTIYQNLNAKIKDLSISGIDTTSGAGAPQISILESLEPTLEPTTSTTTQDTRAFAGTLNGLKMFRRALTAEEILADVTDGADAAGSETTSGTTITSSSSDLIGHWPFDDGFGSLAQDRSPAQRTGLLGTDDPGSAPTWTTVSKRYPLKDNGLYKFNIEVMDNTGATDFASVRMPVDNVAPTAVIPMTDAHNRIHNSFGNHSLKFNGQDDFATAPLTLNSPVTIEAWIRPTRGNSSAAPVFHTGSDENANWALSHNESHWIIGDGSQDTDTNVKVDFDQWQHIAISFVADQGIILFRNGEEAFTTDTISTSQPRLSLTLGKLGAPGDIRFYTGHLDQLRIWDSALSSDEVTAGMRSEVAHNSDNLVAAWNFDDGAGRIAADITGTHNMKLGMSAEPDWSTQIAPVESFAGELTFDGLDHVLTLPKEVLEGQTDVTTTFWIRASTNDTSRLSQLQLHDGATISNGVLTLEDNQYADIPATALGTWGEHVFKLSL